MAKKNESRASQALRDLAESRKQQRGLLQKAITDEIGLSKERVAVLKEVFHRKMDDATEDELDAHERERAQARAEINSLFSAINRARGLETPSEDSAATLPEIKPIRKQRRPPGTLEIREGWAYEPDAYSGAYGVYGPWDANLPEAAGYTREFPKLVEDVEEPEEGQ